MGRKEAKKQSSNYGQVRNRNYPIFFRILDLKPSIRGKKGVG